jgi:hypothetical protein
MQQSHRQHILTSTTSSAQGQTQKLYILLLSPLTSGLKLYIDSSLPSTDYLVFSSIDSPPSPSTLHPLFPLHEPPPSPSTHNYQSTRLRPQNSRTTNHKHPIMTSIMSSIMKEYLAPIYASEVPPCLVRDVMLSLFHNIGAIFLLFTLINWILDSIFGVILSSRWVRRRSRSIRRDIGPICTLGVLALEFIGEVVILAFKVIFFTVTMAKDTISSILVSIAATIKDVLEIFIAIMTVITNEEDTDDGRQKEEKKEKEKTSHTSASSSVWTRGRAERLRVETSLYDDSNRNWSNEHGNLSSPESSPVARSVRHIPSVRICRPSPNRVKPVAVSGILNLSAPSERLTYEEYMEWCSVRGIRRGGFGAGGPGTASVSGSSSSGINTPSTSSSSSNPFDTPSASSSSSGGIRTPSATSSSSSSSICTPTSTRSRTSGSTSSRDNLTPTSSSGSQSTVIHTPTSTRTSGFGDSSRPGTPDSASSSGSDSTVIRTPSP